MKQKMPPRPVDVGADRPAYGSAINLAYPTGAGPDPGTEEKALDLRG